MTYLKQPAEYAAQILAMYNGVPVKAIEAFKNSVIAGASVQSDWGREVLIALGDDETINAAVEKYLDYVQYCCVMSNSRDEIMGLLEAGFDVVATIDSEHMLASDPILSTSIRGIAAKFAKDYEADTGISVVYIPCGLQGDLTWHCTNWGA